MKPTAPRGFTAPQGINGLAIIQDETFLRHAHDKIGAGKTTVDWTPGRADFRLTFPDGLAPSANPIRQIYDLIRPNTADLIITTLGRACPR